MWTLAVIGVLTSVVGAFYYLRIIKVMYFDAGGEAFDAPARRCRLRGGQRAVHLLFFVFPAPFVGAAQAAAQILFK